MVGSNHKMRPCITGRVTALGRLGALSVKLQAYWEPMDAVGFVVFARIVRIPHNLILCA